MDERVTAWGVLAFLGELALLACVAGLGLGLPLGWAALASVAAVALFSAVWGRFLAPRARRRMPLAPRLAVVAALGFLTAIPHALSGRPGWGVGAVAAAAVIVVAQALDARG